MRLGGGGGAVNGRIDLVVDVREREPMLLTLPLRDMDVCVPLRLIPACALSAYVPLYELYLGKVELRTVANAALPVHRV